MQFIPSTWKTYGVDANKDGRKDPYNPVDAIFAPPRYLKAAGYEKDVRRAIFAYNHADWYVDSVMLRARLIAGVPADLVGSLTGLTEGRFPVYARARYADDLQEQRGAQARQARPERRQPRDLGGQPALDRHLLPAGRPGRGHQRRRGQEGRRLEAERPLPRAPGRVRQPLHVRAPRQGRALLPGAKGRRPGPQAPGARAEGQPGRRRQAAEAHRPGVRRPPAGEEEGQAERPAQEGGASRLEPGLGAGQGAPVRPPRQLARARGRRARAAARPEGAQGRRLRDLQGLLLAPVRAERQGRAAEAPEGRRARDRRHDPRPARPAQRQQGGPPPLRDPPGRQGRPADRPEADPRRLEAARGDRDLPGLGQERALRLLRRRALDRPGAADAEAPARAPRAGRQPRRALPGRALRHPLGPDRPPRPRDARVPRRVRAQADGHLLKSATAS